MIMDFMVLGKKYNCDRRAAIDFSIISINKTLSALRNAGVDVENNIYKYYEEIKQELKKQESK